MIVERHRILFAGQDVMVLRSPLARSTLIHYNAYVDWPPETALPKGRGAMRDTDGRWYMTLEDPADVRRAIYIAYPGVRLRRPAQLGGWLAPRGDEDESEPIDRTVQRWAAFTEVVKYVPGSQLSAAELARRYREATGKAISVAAVEAMMPGSTK